MTDKNTIARIKLNGNHFEILIDDIDKALAFKKNGEGSINDFLAIDVVFSDSKKGDHAASEDIQKAFGTTDVVKVAEHIVKKGEVQVPVEYKHKELSEKAKQMVEFIVRNAIDPRSDRPYTSDRIETAMKEAGVNITNKPIESQFKEVVEKLSPIIPIKIQTKKYILTIPAQYTGSSYGALQSFKESEEWLGNGDLKVTVNLPNGMSTDFFEKVNSLTHGSVLSEEVRE